MGVWPAWRGRPEVLRVVLVVAVAVMRLETAVASLQDW